MILMTVEQRPPHWLVPIIDNPASLTMVQCMRTFRNIIVAGVLLTHRNVVNDDERSNRGEIGKTVKISFILTNLLRCDGMENFPN